MISFPFTLTRVPARYRANERGVALVVVLLFLILIMLAGVMAVRQSSTDLKTATADQINTLLLQGADGANVKVENIFNGADKQTYDNVMAKNGIFGYLFLIDNKDHELVYCYNPRKPQIMTDNLRIINGSGTVQANGNCVATNANSYISGRNTVLTQVSITQQPSVSSDSSTAYNDTPNGKDVNNITSDGQTNLKAVYNLNIRSTAALPSYNNPGNCFMHSSVSSAIGGTTLSNCLTDANVPKKQIVSQVKVSENDTSIKCIPMGRGRGEYDDDRCILVTQ